MEKIIQAIQIDFAKRAEDRQRNHAEFIADTRKAYAKALKDFDFIYLARYKAALEVAGERLEHDLELLNRECNLIISIYKTAYDIVAVGENPGKPSDDVHED
jgi:hypothetical protein